MRKCSGKHFWKYVGKKRKRLLTWNFGENVFAFVFLSKNVLGPTEDKLCQLYWQYCYSFPKRCQYYGCIIIITFIQSCYENEWLSVRCSEPRVWWWLLPDNRTDSRLLCECCRLMCPQGSCQPNPTRTTAGWNRQPACRLRQPLKPRHNLTQD